ncbi:MAG TPA: hypothetical protein VFQ43_03515 [Nitrososphaera sp.]|nr:hypothetical protein [Nitrososphaera sp.]
MDHLVNILKRFFGKPSATRRTGGPIQKFEREISTWPPDQARTALLLLKASIQGEQAAISRLYGDLTVDQLEAVRKTLQEIENSSE